MFVIASKFIYWSMKKYFPKNRRIMQNLDQRRGKLLAY